MFGFINLLAKFFRSKGCAQVSNRHVAEPNQIPPTYNCICLTKYLLRDHYVNCHTMFKEAHCIKILKEFKVLKILKLDTIINFEVNN